MNRSIERLDPDLMGLVEELRRVRLGRFPSELTKSPLSAFFTAFFLPDDQTRFVAIRRSELIGTKLLNKPMSAFAGTSIHEVMRKMAAERGILVHDQSRQKLYEVLNLLFRHFCGPMTKARPLPRRGRAQARAAQRPSPFL